MANPFAHEPEMEHDPLSRPRAVHYQIEKNPRGVPRKRAAYLCRLCRTFYAPKPPDRDDLVCPAKLLQVLKERVL